MPDGGGPLVSRRLLIKGRVQGVWFRGWAVREATRHGLSGWVRNRLDGTVEILISGSEAAVEAMTDACRRGPPAADVHGLGWRPDAAPAFGGFRTLPTE